MASDAPAQTADATLEGRQRMASAFGWLAGGNLGVLTNFAIMQAWGETYPVTYTTFGLFIVGAFGGIALADRLGPRGFRPLGIVAGVLMALTLGLVLAFLLT